MEQLVRWQRSSDASKRRWGRKIELALVEGSLGWQEALKELHLGLTHADHETH